MSTLNENEQEEQVSYLPMKIDYKSYAAANNCWNEYVRMQQVDPTQYSSKQLRGPIFRLSHLLNVPYEKKAEMSDEDFATLLKNVAEAYLESREELNDKLAYNKELRRIQNLGTSSQVDEWNKAAVNQVTGAKKSKTACRKARQGLGQKNFSLKSKRRSENYKKRHLQQNIKLKKEISKENRKPRSTLANRIVRATVLNAKLDAEADAIDPDRKMRNAKADRLRAQSLEKMKRKSAMLAQHQPVEPVAQA